jgi:hypothetical protein
MHQLSRRPFDELYSASARLMASVRAGSRYARVCSGSSSRCIHSVRDAGWLPQVAMAACGLYMT